jgi:hypothetical protein
VPCSTRSLPLASARENCSIWCQRWIFATLRARLACTGSLLAPARRHNVGFLKRALRAKRWTELRIVEPGLSVAKHFSAELMRFPSGAVTRDELAALARTWQAVFDTGNIRSGSWKTGAARCPGAMRAPS